MKDPDQFKATLADPFDGPRLRAVTEDDIKADEQSFLAFAGMMGVKPPRVKPDERALSALPSV